MLKFELERHDYSPGDMLRGTLRWSLDEASEEIKISLIWFTQGRGTQDIRVADCETLRNAGRSGEKSFAFRLPVQPYSFQGTLISLSWAVEALTAPGEEFERESFTLAPGGEAFVLEKSSGQSLQPGIRMNRKAPK